MSRTGALKACGNRRASVCPACAETYRRDAWRLIAAGLRGGKGMPETVREHPRLFVTFTAPSFGAVHSKRVHPGNGTCSPAHPRNPKARCEHGRKAACWFRHPETELRTVGRPLCVVHAIRRRLRGAEPLDARGRRASEEAAVVLGTWSFVGRGYSNNDSAYMAVTTAGRTREYPDAA